MRSIPSFRFPLIALLMMFLSTAAFAQVSIVVSFGPPALPIYEQPLCPAYGYIWTPGYWAYDPNFGDYYWVPGTWVLAPEVGFLWTPGYWAWAGNGFVFNQGYWGPVVGFYGGIVYGFGYFGHGYEGGRWDNGQFYYNRSVNNVNVTNIHNVYNTTVVNATTVNRISYNGGPGGINARPTSQEEAAANEMHIAPVAAQNHQIQAARADPQLRASVNQGKPPIAATQKPGEMRGDEIVPANEAGAPYLPPANRVATPVHAKDLPPHQPLPRDTGNAKQDQQYQQQQQKLAAQQEKEHQQLAQQQEQEHQQLQQQQENEEKMQQMEQMHAQQTMQMEQRHVQQQQQMQQWQAPPPPHNQSKPPKG
jgi:DNA segregation ATPase FtsK/SpoIIIE-like protein